MNNSSLSITVGVPRSATGTEMGQKLQWTTLAQRRRLYAVNIKLTRKCNLRMGHDCHTSITSSRVYQALQRDKLEDLPQENYI